MELDRGTPFRNTAEQYQVSASSLFRHKEHITTTPQPEAIVAVSNNGGRVERLTGQPENLTMKQRLFVEAYIGRANGNGVQAARIAGYGGDDATLRSIASENLTKPNIASRVRERLEESAMSADEVLAELTRVAKADWSEFVQVKYGKEGEMIDAQIQLKDKVRSLELLGKHHKLFVDRTESVNANVNLNAEYSHDFTHFLSQLEAIDDKAVIDVTPQ